MDNSTNNVSMEDETEVTECDGEPVVTMMDVLKEQQEFEEDANAVLGASDDKNCTFSKGYIKRQAVYACLTCCNDARFDPTKRTGVCLACSLNCHENHDLVELYTKRNFRCDCGNPKFSNHPCNFTPNKTELNEDNKYNQNFSGLYCICHRPYPDPESSVEDEMIQCIICEDWLHACHLDAVVPPNDQYAEMICKGCMDKNEFIHDYSCYSTNLNSEDEEENVNVCENGNDTSTDLCNGNLNLDELETNKITDTHTLESDGSKELSKCESDENKMNVDEETECIKNVNETEISNENEISPEVDEDCEKKDNQTLETENESCNINEMDSKENHDGMNVNEDTESQVTDEKNQDINDSLKTDETEKMHVLSVEERIPQDEASVKNKGVENEDDSNGVAATPNIILPDNDTNEEIMSEIDKILGSPHDLEGNASLLEKRDILETNLTEKEQETFNSSEDKSNETATEDKTAENDSDKNLDEKILLNKETFIGSEEKETLNEEPLSDVEAKSPEETHDITPKDKSTQGSEDNLDENLSTKNSETTCGKEQKTTEESVTAAQEIEGSNRENGITATESNVENQNENETSTTTLENGLDQSSKIDQPTAETGVHVTMSNPKCDDIDAATLSEADNITDESDSKQNTYEKNSAINSDLQINENSIDTSNAVIPVITEINSMNDADEQAGQNVPFKENKRKLSVEESETQFCNKKQKIDDSEKSCQRPKSAKKKFKGATFWPSDFRQKLCTCSECLTMYKELSVLFLIDPEDTVTAYEALGQAKIGGTPTQYEKGLEALSSLDRTVQINALTEYNKMRENLLDFLKGFKDRKEVVKEEDIKVFFAKLKPRKESDGVYFC